MNTKNDNVNVRELAAKMVAEAQARADAMIREAEAAEETYNKIRELENARAEIDENIKKLRATLPHFGSRAPGIVKEGSPNIGVGKMVKDLILNGYSNGEIVKMVAAHYGNDRTTSGNVSWYRGVMRKAGEI
jgi:hypothetical protein